jgi:uncharacterized oligopeptide transporter (OPT) family protein
MTSKPEITWQSVVGAILVSTIISLAYPYIVLKLGMGPNVSVLAAFLGALFLGVTARATKGQNAVQNNVIQSAATSAASTAFMCVVAAAFGYLAMNESVPVEAQVHIGPWQMFFWLTCSGAIGVFFSALFRKYFIDDPQMIFADGVAAAETINVLDEASGDGGGRIGTLGIAAAVGAVVAFFRDGYAVLATWNFAGRFAIGMEWNVLSIGTGMLIGINVGLSMLLGTAVVWYFGPTILDMAGQHIVLSNVAPQYVEQVRTLIAPGVALTAEQTQFLAQHGGLAMKYINQSHFSIAMMWFMWPATAIMVTAALTAVLLQWKSLVTMFKGLKTAKGAVVTREDVSLRTVILMSLLFTFLLAVFQYLNFDLPIWQTIAAVVLGLPLILVGVRVLGETNNGPVSLMANSVQVIFRAFSPLIGHNLVAAGMSGNINSQGEGLMQVYRTGKLVGSTPRILTWVQFWAVGIGAAAVAIMYPILTNRYRLGEELVAPTGLKLSNMAVLMSKGIAAFPPGALEWTIIAAIAGVVITLLKVLKGWSWLPSAAGFGFALILPGTLNLAVGIGAVIGWLWSKQAPISYERHCITVASGFIGGEALIAGLILPVLFYFGILN